MSPFPPLTRTCHVNGCEQQGVKVIADLLFCELHYQVILAQGRKR